MKKNLGAWKVDFSEFGRLKSLEEKIKFLVKFAVMAPSSHNSQPWLFYAKDDYLLVILNTSRHLEYSDPTGRQMYLSLGCALENILIAADYYNLDVSLEFFPRDRRLTNTAVEMRFNDNSRDQNSSKHGDLDERSLIFDILERKTDRGKYEYRLPPVHFLESIKPAFRHNIRVDIIEQKKKRAEMAEVVIEALGDAMADKDFRKELSEYVKPNATDSKLGMTYASLGIPSLPSRFISWLVKNFNLAKASRKKDLALLKDHTPAFVVIGTQEDNEMSWLEAGQLMQRIWLKAHSCGLRMSPWAAPIEIGDHYKKLQKLLETQFRPQVFMRLGYSKNPTFQSPRLTAEDVLCGDSR